MSPVPSAFTTCRSHVVWSQYARCAPSGDQIHADAAICGGLAPPVVARRVAVKALVSPWYTAAVPVAFTSTTGGIDTPGASITGVPPGSVTAQVSMESPVARPDACRESEPARSGMSTRRAWPGCRP